MDSVRNIREWLRSRTYETKIYLADTLRPKSAEQVRLCIFGQGRSGSTLLEDLLCSTGHFQEKGELLNTASGEVLRPLRYIRGLAKMSEPSNFIFHVKIYQLTRDRMVPIDPARFLKGLVKDGWRIVYLRRRNKLMHALSSIVAEQRGNYHKFDDQPESLRIQLDCSQLVGLLGERFQFEKDEQAALQGIDHHQVIYEDDLEDSQKHQSTVDGVLEYASLAPKRASTRHRKVNAQSLKELVINYDEFIETVAGNGWQEFLEN